MGGGEGDVAEAGGDQAVGLGGGGGGLVGALGGEEAGEALGGERGQEAVRVAEVVRRRGVADAGALGDAAERELLDPLLGELGLCCREERGAQVAVVVGAGREGGVGQGHGLVLAGDPDSVKIIS